MPPLNASSKKRPDIAQATDILHDIFGFDTFRPLQKDIIQHVLAKNDTLAIMPTGGGKSLCYQIPALLFEGPTIVVSPLISLMKDQVDQLTSYGIPAACLNSSLSHQAYRQTLDRIRNNQLDLLYLAPETLMKREVLHLLSDVDVDCIAIDEAHCISEWGHDFRPEYRQLADVTSLFDRAVTVGLTATATPRVQQDIADSLGLRDEQTFIASFNRENLYLNVVQKKDPLQQVIDFVNSHREESGIIYCFSRRQVDELSDDLNANGFDALPYHAGLSESQRIQHQDRFIRDETDIIVATVAFGMGIDKPDVRFVVHHDMPKNIESYYQQIGRAGRDGLQADCLFLFSYGDAAKIRYFINQKTGEEQRVAEQHLQQLLEYVEAPQCRRITLLQYFGEQFEHENCGMCDYCTGDTPEEEDVTIPAQKFLSTMVRTDQRFGYHHIKHILLGSRRKQVLKFNHDTLSTYGIGKKRSPKEWKQVYRELMRQDIIRRDDQHKSLKLTSKAVAILKGDEQVFGVIEKSGQKKKSREAKSDITSLDFNNDLFALLKKKRTEMAKEQNVPPYVIFPDTTLIEMAYYFPQTKDQLPSIHGIGRVKADRYGTAFLPIIRSFCERNGLDQKEHKTTPQKSQSRKPLARDSRPYQVGDLFNEGKSVADIASHFDVQERTVLSNLNKFVKAGHTVSPDRVLALSTLNKEDRANTVNAFEEHGTKLLRPVFDALDEQVSYNDLRVIQLYMLVRE